MKEEKNPTQTLYFFSAVYSSLEKYMRYVLDPQVILTHAILQMCYASLNGRLIQIMRGGDSTIAMPEDFATKLVEYTTELRNKIAENEDIYKTLSNFAYLSYQTTGAGYYTKLLLNEEKKS